MAKDLKHQKEYRATGRYKAMEQNRIGWRLFRLKEMSSRLDKRSVTNMFGHDVDGIMIANQDMIENPHFIVISSKGKITSERLRALAMHETEAT